MMWQPREACQYRVTDPSLDTMTASSRSLAKVATGPINTSQHTAIQYLCLFTRAS